MGEGGEGYGIVGLVGIMANRVFVMIVCVCWIWLFMVVLLMLRC